MTETKVTLRLTPKQARILWQIVDGAQDAGACAGGLTQEEQDALEVVVTQILRKIDLKSV